MIRVVRSEPGGPGVGWRETPSPQVKEDNKMGMLFRMFAPKGLKRARRMTHPVSLLTPRPVRRAKMTAVNIANPAGAAKRAAKRSVVRKARGR
jgi:hypothetical protein